MTTNIDGPLGTQYTLRLVIDTPTQNIPLNQSTFNWGLYAIKNTGSGFAGGPPNPHAWAVNLGGATASGTIPSYSFAGQPNGYALLLASGATTLTHGANGKLTATMAGQWEPDNAPQLAFGSVSAAYVFTDIPRGPFYGDGGSYQRTLAYYGDGGSYQQVLVYYGDAGVWNLVGG